MRKEIWTGIPIHINFIHFVPDLVVFIAIPIAVSCGFVWMLFQCIHGRFITTTKNANNNHTEKTTIKGTNYIIPSNYFLNVNVWALLCVHLLFECFIIELNMVTSLQQAKVPIYSVRFAYDSLSPLSSLSLSWIIFATA